MMLRKLNNDSDFSPLSESVNTELSNTRSIWLRRICVAGELKQPIVSLVEHHGDIVAATRIVNRRYGLKGYGANHRIPTSASHMTFKIEIDGEIMGSITLAVDSPSGLASEKTFSSEIDQFRAVPGARLCELTKFAFKSTINSKQLMASLFHIVFIYGGRNHHCTDLFIEVHAQHAAFYEAMLGFRQVSPRRVNESVGVPLQLMQLKVAEIRNNINLYAGRPSKGHSLYPMFFSPDDEDGIYDRLQRAASDNAQPWTDACKIPEAAATRYQGKLKSQETAVV